MLHEDTERLERRLAALEQLAEQHERELAELRRELGRRAGYQPEPRGTRASHPAPTPVTSEAAEPAEGLTERTAKAKHRIDLEFLLGGRGLLLVGVTALVFAVAFFVKEAMERGWLSPTIRVLAGAGVGVVAAIAGERIRSLGYRTYGLWLAAGGFSAIYLSIWAAAALYGLVAAPTGLVLMVIVVVAAAGLGRIRDSESFVALAAFGGYLAPILLKVETPSSVLSLGYIAALTAAALVLARQSRWAYLAAVAVVGGSTLALVGAGSPHLHGVYLVALVTAALVIARKCRWPAVSLLAVLIGWIVFWVGSDRWDISMLTFSTYALAIWLANLWASLGVTDWVTASPVADESSTPSAKADRIALRQQTLPLAEELCGLGVTLLPPWFFFLSAMSGIDASAYEEYLSEIGLILAALLGAVYVGQAVAGRPGTGAGSRLWRAGLGYVFLLTAPSVMWEDIGLARAWLVEGVAFTIAGVGLRRVEARAAGLAAFTLAVLVYWGTVTIRPDSDPAFIGGWALTGFAVAIGLALWAQAVQRVQGPAAWETALRPILLLAAAVVFLGWGTGEIDRFFELKGGDERWRLARDLSISAFWMLYAAALLGLGLWRKQAAIRWVGLVMALIAASKVFVYDLSNLARLYRIFSFVLLAAVLLALSFWYQRLRAREGSQSA
ncbi:MAG TPA: DUF2339 domain-containing protein [Gemmatimonadota bacterium]|nr:DUF2339 domain-containing protein [Gemmatimonadota bacterium]